MIKQKICPKCKSTDVKFDWQIGMVGRSVVDMYTCNKCSYTNRLFPEIDKPAKNKSK